MRFHGNLSPSLKFHYTQLDTADFYEVMQMNLYLPLQIAYWVSLTQAIVVVVGPGAVAQIPQVHSGAAVEQIFAPVVEHQLLAGHVYNDPTAASTNFHNKYINYVWKLFI